MVNEDPRDDASPPDSLAALLEKAAAMSRGTPGGLAPRDARSPSVHRPPPPDPAAEAALAASLADIVHRVAEQSRQKNGPAGEVAAVSRPVPPVTASLANKDPGTPSPSALGSPWASASASESPMPALRAAAATMPQSTLPASVAAKAAATHSALPQLAPPRRARQAALAAGLLGATAMAWWAVAGWMLDPPLLPADQRIAALPAQPPEPLAEPPLAVAAAPAQAQRWAEAAGTLGVVSERDVGPEPGLVATWGRGVPTGLAPITSEGWAESLQALHDQPRVSAVRYEALQAAGRRAPAGGWPALQVVAPLALDAVYFVVRSDSPLQYIHQIRGRSINIGPGQGSRALTARTVYRRLFGTALPRSPLAALDQRNALARLGQDHTLDVVVAVGSSARAWLAGLSAQDAGAYRLLGLDERQPSTRRAVQAFLPATVRAGSLGNFPLAETSTLGVMSFLVTARPHSDHAAAHSGAIAALAGAVCRTTHNRPPEVTVG